MSALADEYRRLEERFLAIQQRQDYQEGGDEDELAEQLGVLWYELQPEERDAIRERQRARVQRAAAARAAFDSAAEVRHGDLHTVTYRRYGSISGLGLEMACS